MSSSSWSRRIRRSGGRACSPASARSPIPRPPTSPRCRADPNITVDQQEALDIGYLAYNTQEKPFDDARVRKALNMAIDKQAIVDAVLPASGRRGGQPAAADGVVA